MRRIELEHAIRALQAALNESGLLEIVTKPEQRKEDRNIQDVLSAMRSYAVHESRFDATTRTLAKIMDLSELGEVEMWLGLIRGDDPVLYMLRARLIFANEYLPKITALLKQKDLTDFLAAQTGPKDESNYGTLRVIVLEESAQFSRPERLIQVLEAVTSLHDSCSRIQGVSSDQLTVLSCDSGSDKSFDFLGIAKIVEQIKEIIIALWERVAFFKERKLQAQVEALSETLPVLSTVTDMVNSNKLSKEEAEIVRRGILNGCKKFIAAGAIIPEIEEHSVHNPRVLMAPERKLLMPPTEAPREDAKRPQPTPPTKGQEPSTQEGALLSRVQQLEEIVKKRGQKRRRPKRAPDNLSSEKDASQQQ